MPIKRVATSLRDYIREERFILEQKLDNATAFTQNYGHFLMAAKLGNAPVSDELVDRATKGIKEAGTIVNKPLEARWIANELRKVKGKEHSEIGKCCVKLYIIQVYLRRRTHLWSNIGTFLSTLNLLSRKCCSSTRTCSLSRD